MGGWLDLLSDLISGGTKEPKPVPKIEEKMCPVHGLELRAGRVPIEYGLLRYPDDYREASASFPYACSKVPGGCCIDYNKKYAQIRYCPECRKAEKAYWKSKHG